MNLLAWNVRANESIESIVLQMTVAFVAMKRDSEKDALPQ